MENAYITAIARKLGVREARRIVGDYVFTADELLGESAFDDAVAVGELPVDRNMPDGSNVWTETKKPYQIPFRALIPTKTTRLIIAGRSISTDDTVYSATRVIPCTMGIGQAAGEAVGIAWKTNTLIPALDVVGDAFEKGSIFLPQLLQSATATQAAFDVIKTAIAASGSQGESKGRIVIATVKGDVHDIGKNIVRVILENYGYDVLDLGRDVPPERVVEAVRQTGAPLVGLSALMTTTVPNMQATIEALHAANLPCKVMVGGAVLTKAYAEQIGADFYAKDAKASADYAKQIFG